MRLPVDDEIYNVNSVWLGPPNRTLPFRARYSAYMVGSIVFVLLQIVERRLGIGLGFFSLAYSLLGTVALTRLILSVVNPDRPLGAVLAAFAHEVAAPRDDQKVTVHTVRPARVRAVPSRPSRAQAKARHRAGQAAVLGDAAVEGTSS
ncbi:hypothetical protein GCM10009721_28150 [Terrabacter tumescens]|uniref:Uncharacterized protein n=1 Tax=Terrabacter tumescens TaxID=60443 RepID=A0ABQ2I3I3_9MICO|nr:hypothetical protein [Terrabacter tumescens]GGM99481.1 hypothetical protein GCM10009721_28150 [Terrabacter tumescens]